MAIATITATALRTWIIDGGELAILDAREEGEFGASHLFWAVPCPLSKMEARVHVLLPCLATRVVCVDDGRGLAERLAAYLVGLGASNVHVLAGGTLAWEAAGNVLFSGVNVPSKAFGEWIEHHFGTQSVDAPELQAWIDSGRNMVVLDSRTWEEYQRMSIPTGMSVPGGELAYRIGDLVPDPQTLVVVNCAGRTRSILGAESLRQAGIPNKVVALRNGTMGWELAGLTCDRGRSARFEPGRPVTADVAMARATAFADRSGVQVTDAAGLAQLAADHGRTLYVLDVRDPAEFAAGHLAGRVSAPGGQLVQTVWLAAPAPASPVKKVVMAASPASPAGMPRPVGEVGEAPSPAFEWVQKGSAWVRRPVAERRPSGEHDRMPHLAAIARGILAQGEEQE